MRSLVITVLLVLGTAFPAWASRQIIGSEQDHSLAGGTGDCESFYTMTFTNFRAEMHDREQREIPLAGVDRLRVTASSEGGVSIRGWNRPYARLIVCRYAMAHSKEQATRLLGAIQITYQNGEIAANGPGVDDTQAWWANMTLYLPRRSAVDVHAQNGGVAIRNMSGHVTAQATRGGISVAQSSGNYKITTGSGGITLERVRGHVDATSQEGAIALRLPATDVPALEARIAGGSEIHCTLRGCDSGLGIWGADRKALRIGAGVPDIRLSTAGATITIAPI
ncbi:MAG: hypothetical protein ABI779_17820 [Acidobacteriota bacterium]